ncbi:MAG: arsenate reductase (azurin) large subunit [Chloroflexi bacterium]|nr:arsenate reductase (azurin) large subunit [Chloroflexota bacterium]
MATAYVRQDKVPLPPTDAKVVTTACDYCIVACGYKVYTWPVGKDGGPQASQNALGADFPGRIPVMRPWVSPNQHTVVQVDGQPHNAVVVPDFDSRVVNRSGNHSIRGGTLALKCFQADGPTADRLQHPMVRVNGELTPVDWDTALDAMAAVSQYVIANHGVSAWAFKMYSYQYFENTYAASKLALDSIRTPAFAPHDKPGAGSDTAGVDDTGIQTFSASYDDWKEADVLFISGTDPFETKTIVFTSWIMAKPKKIIYVLPRKTAGVAWAEANGGLFLQVIPGTDTLLHLAISRIILENGWEDAEWLSSHVANSWEIESGFGRGTRNTPWQWRTTWGILGTDFEGYKEWILNYEWSDLNTASRITGVPAEKIRQAAEMLTGAGNSSRPKASFAFEKGNYWSNNYTNTASFAAMGVLCGAGNRPGQMISRMGGHQRGWMGAAGYPRDKSPEKLPGRRKREMDLDRWVENGKVRFAYVLGTTWTAAMAASQELAETFRKATTGNPHQITSTDKQAIIDTLIQRVDSGGMVVVWQNIYLQPPLGTDLADFVLPAATWGEEDFTRENGERRLRLYSKFYDPPGEAKPDWWILSRFAKKMGFKGYDWETSNDVFEEAARFGRGTPRNYHPLVQMARKQGIPAHELLRKLGTHGIQSPIRWYPSMPEHQEPGYKEYAGFYEDPNGHGVLVGTKRLHDEALDPGVPQGSTVFKKWLTHFSTQSGKLVLNKSPWEFFADFFERIKPDPSKGELWLTNGRVNEIWQSDFDDRRKLYLRQRWPDTFIEIHPEDAARYGIESGDEVRLFSDDILIQTGGFIMRQGQDHTFTELMKQGHIRIGKGDCRAVAIVTDAVQPGLLFNYFLWPDSPTNSLVHRVPDAVTNRYRFKVGKAKIEKIGESPFKNSFEEMTFKSRNVML